jgi:juvenile hormone epoxide hydrolase
MLTKPSPDRDFVFEVIAPSIPGYGFSSAPAQVGFNSAHCARIFGELMERLGHDKFYAQGGDWGSMITTFLATLYPEKYVFVACGPSLCYIHSSCDPSLLRSLTPAAVPHFCGARSLTLYLLCNNAYGDS